MFSNKNLGFSDFADCARPRRARMHARPFVGLLYNFGPALHFCFLIKAAGRLLTKPLIIHRWKQIEFAAKCAHQ